MSIFWGRENYSGRLTQLRAKVGHGSVGRILVNVVIEGREIAEPIVKIERNILWHQGGSGFEKSRVGGSGAKASGNGENLHYSSSTSFLPSLSCKASQYRVPRRRV